jgi:hypothetical protein
MIEPKGKGQSSSALPRAIVAAAVILVVGLVGLWRLDVACDAWKARVDERVERNEATLHSINPRLDLQVTRETAAEQLTEEGDEAPWGCQV